MAKNNMLMLETSDASISTATITIRAINVGKKQMTQSVFRQLPEAVLVDEDRITLTGIPWGWINYRWGDISADYTNFVFQVGTRLFRCAFRVRMSEEFKRTEYHSTPAHTSLVRRTMLLLEERVYLRILGGCAPEDISYSSDSHLARFDIPEDIGVRNSFEMLTDAQNLFKAIVYPDSLRRTYDDLAVRISNDNYYKSSYITQDQKDWDIKKLRNKDKDIAGAEAEIRKSIDKLRSKVRTEFEKGGDLPTIDELGCRISAMYERIRDYRRRWDDLMEQLQSVEQLFIAV